MKIDLKKKENLISSGNLHLGVEAARAINKCITTQALEVGKFRQNARKCLIHSVEKLKERSPPYVTNTHIIDHVIHQTRKFLSKDELLINLFCKMCLLRKEQGWITTVCADRAEASYKYFKVNADVKNQMKELNMDEKLDVLYMSRLSRHG